MENTPKKENALVNLMVNIVIPALILTKGAAKFNMSPTLCLIIALSLPFSYGLYEIIKNKKPGFITILGFVSVLLTGMIGIFEFPPEWIAYKEASIPFVIGTVVLVSGFTGFPVARKILYNKEIFDTERIESALDDEKQDRFDQIFNRASIYLAFSFFLSAFLNFALAKILIQSAPGTEQFNEELGKMTLWSYPVIALPSMIVMMVVFYYLFNSIKKLSMLTSDEIFLVSKK